MQRVLDNLTVPAVVHNVQQDLIGANLLGRALYTMHFEADRPNMVRFIFLDPEPNSIGELSTRSPQFRKDWARQDVHAHRTGQKRFC